VWGDIASQEVAMALTREAVERAMKVQGVIVRGLSGELTWLQVADILGRSPRSIRRMRWRFEQRGYDGLYDGLRMKPSPTRAPVAEVERILGLYRERYAGFNTRHFYCGIGSCGVPRPSLRRYVAGGSTDPCDVPISYQRSKLDPLTPI